jgi:hypothetical protein
LGKNIHAINVLCYSLCFNSITEMKGKKERKKRKEGQKGGIIIIVYVYSLNENRNRVYHFVLKF